MDQRRRVKDRIKNIERVKTWQLLIIFILLGFVAATFLRLNNIGMIERRDAVEAADKEGNPETIKARLYDLQRYSSEHMHASAEVALQHQYNRDWQKSLDDAKTTSDRPNVYINAETVCRPRFSSWVGPAYMQCMMDEISRDAGSNSIDQQGPEPPNKALYQHSFMSPTWSPDFAGWTVLAAGLVLFAIVVRLLTLLVLRLMLKKHYRDA